MTGANRGEHPDRQNKIIVNNTDEICGVSVSLHQMVIDRISESPNFVDEGRMPQTRTLHAAQPNWVSVKVINRIFVSSEGEPKEDDK